jgi:hypothetical protein
VLEKRAEELRPTSMAEFVTTIVRLRLAQLEGVHEGDRKRRRPGSVAVQRSDSLLTTG